MKAINLHADAHLNSDDMYAVKLLQATTLVLGKETDVKNVPGLVLNIEYSHVRTQIDSILFKYPLGTRRLGGQLESCSALGRILSERRGVPLNMNELLSEYFLANNFYFYNTSKQMKPESMGPSFEKRARASVDC